MKELWLIRHAEAEPDSPGGDFARALTERGEAQARRAGAATLALGLDPARVWASPKTRAAQTAKLALPAHRIETVEALASGFDGRAALELAAELPEESQAVLVGHNPDFEQTVFDLTGARVDFKKGGLAIIRLDGSRGTLVGLLRQRELRRIANHDD